MKTLMAAIVALLPFQDANNPEYLRWASFKAGSSVKFKSEIETKGNKMALPVETTRTLLEVDDKKVVIEEIVTSGGKQQESRKRTHQAKVRSTEKVEKEGDEELEVGGKKLACHWTESKPAAGTAKTWTSAEVPGGVVKIEYTVGVGESVHRLIAVSWEKK